MKLDNLILLAAVCSFPSYTCAMQMDPAAPVLQTRTQEAESLSVKMENCFDKSLMCLCGPCFRGSQRAINEISSRCMGQELPISVLCEGYSCCSMQALFWDLLYREGWRPEEGRAALNAFLVFSGSAGACIAFFAHRLECLQKRQRMAFSEHTKVE